MSALNWELGRRTVFRLSVGPIAPHPRGLGEDSRNGSRVTGSRLLLFQLQVDVTHHAGVVHFAVPFALCNFDAQIRQPNTGSITQSILFLVCPARPLQHTLLNDPE